MKRFINQAWLNFKGRYAGISFEQVILYESLYPIITLSFYCILAAYSFNTLNLTKWVVGNSFLLCIFYLTFILYRLYLILSIVKIILFYNLSSLRKGIIP